METHSASGLLEFLESELGAKLTPETRFAQVVEDSLSFLQLMLDVREKFGPISNEQLTGIETVGDLLRHYEMAEVT
jgi:acyl carrier protein